MSDNRIYLYDSTLRDGAQTQGVNFSVHDKTAIAQELDLLGIDYVEGGWIGVNPTDDSFFAKLPKMKKGKITAFGMTRRSGRSADNDPGLTALLSGDVSAVCMVGKSWDFQVEVALGVGLDENLDMIRESMTLAVTKKKEVLFDAEHFFDGYKSNSDYALECIKTAYKAGARWVVLCDTNGGTLPHEVSEIVTTVSEQVSGDHLGIHCHDDTGNAAANSLAAVRAGACQIQGTFNGLGERCGNANLVSLIPTLILKMGFKTGVTKKNLAYLTHVSRLVDERLSRTPYRGAPYVGESAFTHKGGLHVAAVEKDPRCYEHVLPESVGNQRNVVISDQSGRANIMSRFRDIGLDVDSKDPKLSDLVELVKEREYEGYAYDGAEASFELLARRTLEGVDDYFRLDSFRITDERRCNAKGEVVALSEAITKIEVRGKRIMSVAEGNGPVSALDAALRKALAPAFPELKDLRLVDYKVRILTPSDGTKAVTRVMIESADAKGRHWATVGVSTNVIEASFIALNDSIVYKLFLAGAKV
jgi:2-isopropylmalate synthase